MKLVYKEPATRWGEALPLGNGQIGAMVYGHKTCEKINLTENTFYSGATPHHVNQQGAKEAFTKMRQADGRGEYDQVHKEAELFIGRRENYGTHLPTGDLRISYELEDNLKEYERGLDIRSGKAWVIRGDGNVRIVEEVWVSQPDKIMVLHMKSDKKTNMKLWFEPNNQEGGLNQKENGIKFWADAFETIHCNKKIGVHLEGAITVKTDGQVQYDTDGISVFNSLNTVFYLAMETNYKQEEKTKMELYTIAEKRCRAAEKQELQMLFSTHAEDMGKLTNGMELEIDGIDQIAQKIPFLFQYGRYLLFCSSREDSKLPTHLQGIWNDNVACRIGWTCDMHLDINTQMNYWPAEFSGLSQTTAPLFRWMKDILVPEGRKTAAIAYGQSGWVGEIVSNAWGYAAPYWASPIAPCPTGGVWILTHVWEHYLYTKDCEFLEKVAFGLIEEAVSFFVGYVYQTESGAYTCGPSISPENSFLYKGESRQISSGCTYEILMIRELFDIYMKAAEVLDMTGTEMFGKVKEIYERLLPYRILENGCIAEWNHNLPEADIQHRHTSHLLGLFPFAQITPEETPDLCEAAEKTIQRKLTPMENWEDTGWARSMLMLYEARLQNGEKAYGHICSMVEELLEPNQMIYHPPTRGAGAFDHVYELDGNTGLCSCIGEMLIQSHQDRIRLLPALPKEWKNGAVRKFQARGNVQIDMKWKAGLLECAVLRSAEPHTVTLLLGEKLCTIEVGGETVITAKNFK